MSDNFIVTVQDDSNYVVAVQERELATISTNTFNAAQSIGDIANVDTSGVTNGSVLVYKTLTNKWTATTTLDAQNMEGGEF